jgi:uncharacterized RDD family membrane protein YckC
MDDSSFIWQRIGATVIDYAAIFGLCAGFIFIVGTMVAPNSWQATVINFPIPFLVRRLFDLVDLSCTGGVLAFILVLATHEHQRVGDLVSQTRVVGRNFSHDIHFDFESA